MRLRFFLFMLYFIGDIMIINWKDDFVTNLDVTQVYGIIFSNDGRILLKCENKNNKKVYSFFGGHPEDFDTSYIDTLNRELFEEANISVSNPIYVGYQYVDEENGKAPYAQLRYTAVLDIVGKNRPDLDNNILYERILCPPQVAVRLLGWGDIALKQINASIDIAKRNFCFNEINNNIESI